MMIKEFLPVIEVKDSLPPVLQGEMSAQKENNNAEFQHDGSQPVSTEPALLAAPVHVAETSS